MPRAVPVAIKLKLRRLGSSGRLDFVLLIFLSVIFLSVSFLPHRIGKAPTEKCRTEK